jgi:hypothetical protein
MWMSERETRKRQYTNNEQNMEREHKKKDANKGKEINE